MAEAGMTRLRRRVTEIAFPELPDGVTISIGVAAWHPGESRKQLVARADAAMYQAKRNGRNRIRLATPAEGSDP